MRPQPPTPSGEELLRLERSEGQTLRIAIDHYESHPYISLSTWQNGWPVKGKTLSFRIRELPNIIEALTQAADDLARPAPPPTPIDPDAPRYVERNRRPTARNDRPLPPVVRSAEAFDEF